MRLLICGGRDYSDYESLVRCMSMIRKPLVIIHGNAKGADSLADRYALTNGIPVLRVPAEWEYFGKRAGMLRNEWMIDLALPNYCIALPGGVGTKGMVSLCRKKNIPVWIPYEIH